MTNSTLTTILSRLGRPASAKSRHRALMSLVGLYLFVVFALPVLTDEAGLLWLRSRWLRDVDRHWLYGCAMLTAGWVALGPGTIFLRLPLGLILGGCVLLAWVLGLTISPNWKFELELVALTGATLAVTTFVLLLGLRGCWSKVLSQSNQHDKRQSRQFQYSLATLLLVMLLVGAIITLFGWIDPLYRRRSFEYWYSATWLGELAGQIRNEAIGPLLVAAACLPVFLHYGRRRMIWGVGLSAAGIMIMVLGDNYIREYVLIPLLAGTPLLPGAINSYLLGRGIPYAANVTTLVICLLSAATAMRWLGYGVRAASSNTSRLDTTPSPS